MDPNKNNYKSSIYPEPTKGPLASGRGQLPAQLPKSNKKFRDHSPATVLAMIAIPALLFGAIGFAVFYLATQKSNNVDGREAAVIVARKVSEMPGGDASQVTTEKINQTFENCKITPHLIVTHSYKPELQRPSAESHISLGQNVDLTDALSSIVEKADQAETITLDITCG